MSNLVAIAYPDRQTAEHVRRTLVEMQKEHIVEFEDMVVVTRSEAGKVKLDRPASVADDEAGGGAPRGGLIGLLYLVGVDESFVKELGESLAGGTAAVIVLLRRTTPDKVLPRIREYGGRVIRTPLNQEAEDSLRAALGETVPA